MDGALAVSRGSGDDQAEPDCAGGGGLGRLVAVDAVLWSLHAGLPRQAPGSDATTRAMLETLDPPPGARAVDMGCGPGRSSLVLAAAGLDVLAVDTHQPFLASLTTAACAAGLSERVRIMNTSMDAVTLPGHGVDVVWSEGAAYLMGFAEALSAWSTLLRPGGGLAVTECCWLTDHPSPATARFWATAYPAMRSVPQTLELIDACRLHVMAHWTLPDSDWWDEYYGELRQRIARLDPDQRADSGVRALISELNLRVAHPDEYGYVAFVLRRTDST